MSSVNSYRLAGRAAYLQQTNPSQETARSQPSSNPEAASEAQDGSATRNAAKATATQSTTGGDLSAQEQQMIERNFPEKPELSMRLYGRSRGTQTVNPSAVGSRLDVQG